jgi:uncharacterized Zn-finger protein
MLAKGFHLEPTSPRPPQIKFVMTKSVNKQAIYTSSLQEDRLAIVPLSAYLYHRPVVSSVWTDTQQKCNIISLRISSASLRIYQHRLFESVREI